ncbi:MCM2 3 5 family protein [Rutstroemia sp. NJR-2017a WRK4]|nr:MCM2 3 5 family protein [Rutstroemia sp. NJR-2017a WRK4]
MSSANRGVDGSRNRRKRSREPDDDLPGAPAASSPPGDFRSSPPAPIRHGVDDDDDDDMEDDVEIAADIDDIDELAEDEDGIDLFGGNYERDYNARDNTNYEGADIDDEGDYEELDAAARRQLEARLNRRDRELARQRRMPAAFLQDEDDEGDLDLMNQPRRRRHHYDEDEDEDMADDIMEEELSLETLQDVKSSSLVEWIATPSVQRTIRREFKAFLTEYTDDHGVSVYGSRIKTLGEINAESLEVSYDHLSASKAILAYFLANAPGEMLLLFDEVAMEVTLLHYNDYRQIHSEIHVRITDLPVHYTLRQLRQTHLNCLVRVSGVVTRRSGVFPQLKYVMFDCTKCGTRLGPFQQESNVEVKISFCSNCQSRGPFNVNSEKTVYRNYQKLTLQESPGTVPAGRLPRHREVILLWDLIDKAKPGEEIEVTGVYLAKVAQGKHHIRGDINVLLLGDPGTAKSQVLKYVEKTAHRAVFATGQGASAVGLTASVRKDPLTSEWTLEGGALVLADRGTCLIDEFDKMNDQDRTSIHEAMEQQTISISKAGIVTTLQARCGIIAAANPIGGRYNSTIPFSQNVELTEPILSRFDILCVVRDTVDPAEDERLARFVVGSHGRSHPGTQPLDENQAAMESEHDSEMRDSAVNGGEPKQEGEIKQELLRKYILYAREKCSPKLYNIDEEKVSKLFADMRRESLATGAYPITVRHLEAIMRISEAFCRMRLSEYVSSQDIDRAIAVTIESFVGSQKVSCKKALARAFAKYTLARPGAGRKNRNMERGQRAATATMA